MLLAEYESEAPLKRIRKVSATCFATATQGVMYVVKEVRLLSIMQEGMCDLWVQQNLRFLCLQVHEAAV